ncbi:MAG: hypothetical protein V4674_00595 [Patescibacteria group bacterium]
MEQMILENGRSLLVAPASDPLLGDKIWRHLMREARPPRTPVGYRLVRIDGELHARGTVIRDGKAIPMYVIVHSEGQGMKKITRARVIIGTHTHLELRAHRHGKEADQHLRRFAN